MQSLMRIYGWRDFGDRLRPGWCLVDVSGTRIPGFYNDTHVGATNLFKQYLRTSDKRWWELAEDATRHFMDIDVAHCNRKGYWDQNGPAWGNLGPGECNMTKHEMVDHDDRNLHFGHAHLSGLADYYLLTGDPRALEVAREIGDWWSRMSPLSFPVPVPNPHVAEAERDYAWPLFTMNEVYRATGDPRYLRAAAQEVRHLIGWWKTPSTHYVNGAVVGQNDYASGTGWWCMYPRCDNSPSPPTGTILYNGTNPWMAGPLFSSLIQFYQYNTDLNLVDSAEIKEMLLQTYNYVVKYGWDESKQYFPYDYFIYSEATPQTDGGKNHLLYPAICLWLAKSMAGTAHPEWYTTADKWLTIAASAYSDWKSVKYRGTTDLGFYGYEIIFPLDFFSIMGRLESPSQSGATVPESGIRLLTVTPLRAAGGAVRLTISSAGHDAARLQLLDMQGRRLCGGRGAALDGSQTVTLPAGSAGVKIVIVNNGGKNVIRPVLIRK